MNLLVTLLIALTTPSSSSEVLLSESEMCSLVEQSVIRLGQDIGDSEEIDQASKAAATIDESRRVDLKQRGTRFRGRWGECRISVPRGTITSRVDDVRVAPGGRLAIVSGGWVGGELLGSGGECYFNKDGPGWRLIGCLNTWSL
jgi:hypothetical protein